MNNILSSTQLNEIYEIFNNIDDELLNEFIGALGGTSYEKDHQASVGVSHTNLHDIENHSFKGIENLDRVPNFSKGRGVLVSYCHSMKPWQQNVVKHLRENDLYLVASPGAGKTLPVMCYYYNSVLGLNTSLFSLDQKFNNRNYASESNITHQNMIQMLHSIDGVFRIDTKYSFEIIKLLNKFGRNIDINRVAHSNNAIEKIENNKVKSEYVDNKLQPFVVRKEQNYPGQAVIALPRRSLLSNYERDIKSNFAEIIRGCLSFLSFYSSFGNLHPHGSFQDDPKNTKLHPINSFNNINKLNVFVRLIGCLDAVIDDKTYIKNYFVNRFSILERVKANYKDMTLNKVNSANLVKNAINELSHLDNELNNRLDKNIESFISNNILSVRSGNQEEGSIKDTLITLCITQSLNKTNIIKDKVNLKLFFIDEAHELNYKASEFEIDTKNKMNYDKSMRNLDEMNEKVAVIKKALKLVSEKGDNRIVFATGTINPESALNMVKYISKNYKRKMKLYNQGELAKSSGQDPDKNASNITIRVDNNLGNLNHLTKLLISPRSTNNLIVLMNKANITSICENALKKLYPHSTEQINVLKKYEDIPLASRGSMKIKDLNLADRIGLNLKNRVQPDAKVEEITTPFLKQCVLAGFGYIMRPEGKDVNDPRIARDQEIVSELFSKGKIHTLLATTAVGIGVNIKVETMYIPDPTLGNSSTFSSKVNGLDELSQLLNRTGRADFKYSYIVTTDKSRPLIEKALNSTPDDFEKRFVL